jgi:two-component system CheB/CheR fusion protein
MEEELKELKDKLNSALEQLDASNENMQSFNEELLSANEEMQSTNEEMQSVNEELDTINANYQLKNKELLEMNDDLNNYFRSNINGQLFVNNELLLMKFSPGTVKLINLQDSDIGRPISNISTNMKLNTITEDVKQVLAEGAIITKEVEATDGKWYQIMTMPYIRQADNKAYGAVITFADVTALKTAQQELDKKNKSLLRINADLDNFVLTASHDLLAPLDNIEASINVMNNIKLSDEGLVEFLGIINSSIKNFRTLVKDIATIAKVENDLMETELVDLDMLITNIAWSLETKIKSSGAVINRNFEVKQIHFSRKSLRSILFNLISNGIKFSGDKKPVIDIYSAKKDGYTQLVVQDNGIGISVAGVAKMFEKYARLATDVEGQGVGLYLVKKIVDAAGGTINVDSELGKGSRFTINFLSEVLS